MHAALHHLHHWGAPARTGRPIPRLWELYLQVQVMPARYGWSLLHSTKHTTYVCSLPVLSLKNSAGVSCTSGLYDAVYTHTRSRHKSPSVFLSARDAQEGYIRRSSLLAVTQPTAILNVASQSWRMEIDSVAPSPFLRLILLSALVLASLDFLHLLQFQEQVQLQEKKKQESLPT